MNDTIEPGLYKHYRGGLYHVIGVGRHSETTEVFVVYHHLDGDPGLWIRPIGMFKETVIYEGREVPRFLYQKPFVSKAPEFLDADWRARESKKLL